MMRSCLAIGLIFLVTFVGFSRAKSVTTEQTIDLEEEKDALKNAEIEDPVKAEEIKRHLEEQGTAHREIRAPSPTESGGGEEKTSTKNPDPDRIDNDDPFYESGEDNQGDQRSSCGGTVYLTSAGATLTSPNYPSNYPVSQDCIWTIVPPSGNQVSYSFSRFNLEYHWQCNWDYLEIRNGRYSWSPLLAPKTCGTRAPASSTSDSYMRIRFFSDFSVVRSGFSMTLTPIAPCGGNILVVAGQSGQISSPNHPGNYDNYRDCTWRLIGPSGSIIRATFSPFELENHWNCRYDYLEVRDGGSSSSSEIGKYCGNRASFTLASTNNQMRLHFHSDGSIVRNGFSATYSAEFPNAGNCGGDFSLGSSNPSEIISTPNHPQNYANNLNCVWTFSSPTGSNIEIDFSFFVLEDCSSCCYDYLEVRDGSSSGSSLMGKYCGTNRPPTLTTSGNRMYVKFRSDGSVYRPGFRATVSYTTGGTTPTDDCGISGDGRLDAEEIVGGQDANDGEYPWQVYLSLTQRGLDNTWCGGSLLNSQYVMTAAHCTDNAQVSLSNLRVTLGTNRANTNVNTGFFIRQTVTSIVEHPGWNPRTNDNDFSILKMRNPVTFTNRIRPICLPTRFMGTFAGDTAVVTGWGDTTEGGSNSLDLQEVEVDVLTNAQCSNAYSQLTSNMICAASPGKDSCQGDSGGPLQIQRDGKWRLIGVVSFGRGCARPDAPGVYARVTEVLGWINCVLNGGTTNCS